MFIFESTCTCSETGRGRVPRAPRISPTMAPKSGKRSRAKQYRYVGGVRYDESALVVAEGAVLDHGKITLADAEAIYEDTLDGPGVTETEYATLRFVLEGGRDGKQFHLDPTASDFLVAKLRAHDPKAPLSPAPKPRLYRTIRGVRYDENALTIAEAAVKHRGHVAKEDAEAIWKDVHDHGEVTDTEFRTLARVAGGAYKITAHAKRFLLQKVPPPARKEAEARKMLRDVSHGDSEASDSEVPKEILAETPANAKEKAAETAQQTNLGTTGTKRPRGRPRGRPAGASAGAGAAVASVRRREGPTTRRTSGGAFPSSKGMNAPTSSAPTPATGGKQKRPESEDLGEGSPGNNASGGIPSPKRSRRWAGAAVSPDAVEAEVAGAATARATLAALGSRHMVSSGGTSPRDSPLDAVPGSQSPLDTARPALTLAPPDAGPSTVYRSVRFLVADPDLELANVSNTIPSSTQHEVHTTTPAATSPTPNSREEGSPNTWLRRRIDDDGTAPHSGGRDALESGSGGGETPVAGATADHLTYRRAPCISDAGLGLVPARAAGGGDVRPAAVPQGGDVPPRPKSAAAEVLFGFLGFPVSLPDAAAVVCGAFFATTAVKTALGVATAALGTREGRAAGPDWSALASQWAEVEAAVHRLGAVVAGVR